MSLSDKYAKFDAIDYDAEDEEEKQAKAAEEAKRKKASNEAREKAAEARAKAAGLNGGSPLGVPPAPTKAAGAAGPNTMMEAGSALQPDDMTEEQRQAFANQYQQMFSRNRPKKDAYKFPETFEEQKAKADEADVLRLQGNQLFKKGALTEAAKLYEQSVLKFADWYADCFATDEEKAMVHAVKTPAHLNLALCSLRLGNYAHGVVHCTSALERVKENSNETNAKAYFRRGACHHAIGNLTEAKSDLSKALQLSPNDMEIRKEMSSLREREREYKGKEREIYTKSLAGAAGDGNGDGSAAAVEEEEEVVEGAEEPPEMGEEEAGNEVLRDISWHKVSLAGARDDYGVVVRDDGTAAVMARRCQGRR